MAKVESPNKDYSGLGPGNAVFKDGTAETDDGAALNYYRSAGYAVDGKVENPVKPTPEPPDPREVGDEVLGTRLRDAAVDPKPEDFLPPVNAGQDNPHGSNVVSPEIHASGPAGIRPGDVFVEDIAKQEKRESEFAEARIIDQVKAADAVAAEVPDIEDRGPIELSDPGSVPQGIKAAEEQAAKEQAAAEAPVAKTAAKRTTKKA